MKTVLYTFDFEPITVVDIPLWLYNSIETEHRYHIQLWVPPEFVFKIYEGDPLQYEPPETVTLHIEKFVFRGKVKYFFFVNEKELVSAFKLKSTYLAGQNRLRDATYQQGVSEGIAKALVTLFNQGRD